MNGSSKTRIGILGGTFNPVHTGHLILAQAALETYELGRVLFVPCARPPHKDHGALLAPDRRRAMLALAVEDDLRFEICDLELERGGVSYAIDTVKALVRENPDADLFFIIGDDTLMELHMWHRVYDLLALCTFVTFARDRAPEALTADRLGLDAPWPERLLRHTTFGRRMEIASSDIRHRVAEGLSIRYLVPDAVAMYIAEHGLYQNGI